MHEQSFTCADCGALSPATDEGETVTRQHGWRITRKMLGKVVVIEPRCAQCYARSRGSLPPGAGKQGAR